MLASNSCKWEVVLGGRYLRVIFVSFNGCSWILFFWFFSLKLIVLCDDSAIASSVLISEI